MAGTGSLFEKKESMKYDLTQISQYVTLTVKDTEIIYDGEPHFAAVPEVICSGCDPSAFTIEYSENGIDWSTDPASVQAVNVKDSKEVYIRVYGEGLSGYIEGTEKITIKPRPVVLQVESFEKTVGDNDPAFLGNGDLSGFVSTDDIGIRYKRTDAADNSIGVHKGVITADILYGNIEDYDITIIPGDLTINDVGYSEFTDADASDGTAVSLSAPAVPQSMSNTAADSGGISSMTEQSDYDSRSDAGGTPVFIGIALMLAVTAAAIVHVISSKVRKHPLRINS